MFCSKQSNNLKNKIKEWSLRVKHEDQKTSCQNLLETHNELTIHHASVNDGNL